MIPYMRRGLPSRLRVEGGTRPVRLFVGVIAAAALVAVLVEFGGAYGSLDRRARGNRNSTLDQRNLMAAYATDMSRDFVRAARDLVPPDATFAVETGDKVVVSTPVSIYAVRGYSQYQLYPRRLVGTDTAQWLLCYGCDQPAVAGRFDPVWAAESGIAIMKARQ